jgi:hypothetical protein
MSEIFLAIIISVIGTLIGLFVFAALNYRPPHSA